MSTDEDDLPPVPREKLSKTPSWIMVGFVIGCVFAYIVNREVERRGQGTVPGPVASSRPAPAPAPAVPETPPAMRLSQNEVDAMFHQVSENAVWENDLTQIAVWNPLTKKFSDLVEVMRSGEYFYYRPLTHLTRPLITAEAGEGVLILFTETEAARAKRLEPIPPVFRPAPPKLSP
ncbi:MAG: hypothetical protein QM760_18935 [Nibricoccus sp.]